MCKKLLFLTSLVVVLALVGNAYGVGYTWTDANGSGTWFDPCNWTPYDGNVPDFNDNIYIKNDADMEVDYVTNSVGQIKVGGGAEMTTLTIRTGGWMRTTETSSYDDRGDLLCGSSSASPATIRMSGGELCEPDNFQVGKRAEGHIELIIDDGNDPGGDPCLWTTNNGAMKLGGSDGGSGSVYVLLHNGKLRADGFHIYTGEVKKFDIEAGVLEAGDDRLNNVAGNWVDMAEYIEYLYYDLEVITCYEGTGELAYEMHSPSSNWITVWCIARDPICAGAYVPKNRAQDGPYEEPCPNAAGDGSKLNLEWDPGNTADAHRVYVSDVFDEVNEGTIAYAEVAVPNYTPPDLNLSTTYYWRVDEVNNGSVVCVGSVLEFDVPQLTIEDFEVYTPAAVYGDWSPAMGDNEMLSFSVADAYDSAQSLQINFADGGDNYADAILSPTTVTDWTYGGQAVSLSLWYKAPAVAQAIQLKVNANSWVDIGAVLNDCWWQTNVSFTALGGGLGAVSTFTIRLGNGSPHGNEGDLAYIDDIAVWGQRCMPDINPLLGDVDGDCVVDIHDVDAMGENWLYNDRDLTPADGPFTGDPQFVTDDPCAMMNPCVEFDGVFDKADIPDEPFAKFNDNTVTAWVKRLTKAAENSQTGRVFFAYDSTYRLYMGIRGRNGRPLLNFRLNGGSDVYGFEIPEGVWVNLAWVVRKNICDDRVCGEMYMDGVRDPNSIGNGNLTNRAAWDTSGHFKNACIGGQGDVDEAHAYDINARLHDIRIYSYALSASEIAYIATGAGTVPDSSKLLANYAVNQTSGTSLLDIAAGPHYKRFITRAEIAGQGAVGTNKVNLVDYAKLTEVWGNTSTWP